LLNPDKGRLPTGGNAAVMFTRDPAKQAAVYDFIMSPTPLRIERRAPVVQKNRPIRPAWKVCTIASPVPDKGRLPTGGNAAVMFTRDPAKQAAVYDFIKFAAGPFHGTMRSICDRPAR
jgi:multiple sugar transport system substrate-binding protein